jgi:hypothetical protein
MGRLFASSGEQMLPPTCMDEDGLSRSNCSIYYHLTARVPRAFSDWEDKASLNFIPFRRGISLELSVKPSKDRGPEHVNYRISHDATPRALTKSELLKHSFHRNVETRTKNFTLEAAGSTRIVLGETYPITLTLISSDVEISSIAPTFTLKSHHLRLKSQTDIRVPGALFGDYTETLSAICCGMWGI